LPGAGCQHLAQDQVPCPVTDGCSKSATCDKGMCKPGAEGAQHILAYKLSTSYTKWSTLTHPVAGPDGELWGLVNRSNNKETVLLKVDKWGVKKAFKAFHSPGGYSYTSVHPREFWRRSDGSQWGLFYQRISSGATYQAYVLGRDVDDKVLVSKGYYNGSSAKDPKAANTEPVALLWYPDQTRAVVAAVHWLNGQHSGQVIRTQGNGVTKWTSTVDADKTFNEAPAAAAGLGDGSAVVAGVQWIDKQPGQGLLYKVDNGGKLLWRRSYDPGVDGRFRFIAVMPDGGFLLVGRRDGGGVDQRPWIVRTNSAGALRWQRMPKLATTFSPSAFAPGPGQAFTLAATIPQGIVSAAQMVHFDAVGNMRWQRTFKAGASAWMGAAGLLRMPSGGFALTGGADAFGAPNPMVVRTDPWGHAPCSASGKCVGKKADGCDDGDACTDDSCDPKTGCGHSKTDCVDGNLCTTPACDAKKGCTWKEKSGACDDGNKCTAVDACKGGLCQAVKNLDCDDGNPCSIDICDTKAGCQHALLDGDSCPAPGGCSKSGVCVKGVCKSTGDGKLFGKVWKLSNQFYTYDAFHSVLPGLKGGYHIVHSLSGKNAALRTVDAWGKDTGSTTINPAISSTGGWVHRAARRLPDGDLLFAAYYRYGYTTNYHAFVRRRGPNGKAHRWDAKFPLGNGDYKDPKSGSVDPRDLLDYPDATLAVVGGIYWKSGYYAADVIRIQGNGKLKWRKQSHADKGHNEFGRAGLSFKDGSTVVAGYAWKTGAPYDGLLYKLDNQGKQLWKQTWDAGASELATRLAPLSDGGFLAAGGRSVDGKTWQPWLARADSAGKLLWHKTAKVAGDSQAAAMNVDAQGRITLVGTRPDGIVQRLWMMRLSPVGEALWTRDIKIGASSKAGTEPLAALPGGGFAIAGGATMYGSPNPMLVVTDHWGHFDCNTPGKCAGKLAKDCDDGQPCTADGCDSAKGCTATGMPDGTSCATGKTCKSSKCGGP